MSVRANKNRYVHYPPLNGFEGGSIREQLLPSASHFVTCGSTFYILFALMFFCGSGRGVYLRSLSSRNRMQCHQTLHPPNPFITPGVYAVTINSMQ